MKIRRNYFIIWLLLIIQSKQDYGENMLCKLRKLITGADPGEGGVPGAPPPLKLKKKIHTKYPKIFRASLRSAQLF